MLQLIPKPAQNHLHHTDPLTNAIAPSPNESQEERTARLKAEEQAKKLSDEIDRFLKKSATSGDVTDGFRRKSMAVKVLLLGQSECGKSTALKNFQLLYNPQSFQAERAAWRMVILFNLTQSIRVLHTVITEAMQSQQQLEADHLRKSPTSPLFARSPLSDFQDLFPQQQQQQQSLHRKRSSGFAELTNGASTTNVSASHNPSDHDQTDAASTYSAATSSSSTKHPHAPPTQRRSSFFGSSSKESKPSKENKKSRSRPATTSTLGAIHTAPSSPISVTTPTTNAFCLPTQTFGYPGRRDSPPSQSQSHSKRRAGSDDIKATSSPPPLNGARSTGHLNNPTSSATAITASASASPSSGSSSLGRSPKLSLSIPPASPNTSTSSRSPARLHAPSPASAPPSHPPGLGNFTAQHQLLLMRLKPLLTVELALLRRLSLPDELEDENDVSGGVTQRNTEGGYEAPAKMTANAARGGPITQSTSAGASVLRNNNGEREAVKLDFNLAGMHNAAVNAAKEGMIDFSAPSFASLGSSSSKGTSSQPMSGLGSNPAHISKTSSVPGRPRARSSVDISAANHTFRSSASNAVSNAAVSAVGMRAPIFTSSGQTRAATFSPATTMAAAKENSGGSVGNKVGWTGGLTIHPSISASSLDLAMYHPHAYSNVRSQIPVGEATMQVPEFFVRSTTNWKEKLKKWKRYDPGVKIGLGGDNGGKAKSIRSSEWNPWDEEEDPAHLIQACAQDVKGLWNDPIVRDYLAKNRYRLEHLPGFFLSDVDRIVSREYTPTDDDILRARLKTIGAVEHKFSIDTRGSVPRDWLVYDVGGARTQRAAWVPYFDGVDAIIFIVSLSSFDQSLSEDPSVNRMEDSLRSFRDLVSNSILKDVNIILFLNKVDLLDSKLSSGIQLARYFKRYGDRPNTTDAVTRYFRAKFAAIYEKFTPQQAKRVFSVHATSLTNPQSTRLILQAVNESIMQMHISKSVS